MTSMAVARSVQLVAAVGVVVLLNISLVSAWGDMGHTLVAEIARRELTLQEIANVDAVTGTFYEYYPWEISYIPYAATFMDKIKGSTSMFNTQHYVDYPVEKDEVKAPELDPTNLQTCLKGIMYKIAYNPKETTAWGQGLSMMMLIHLLGDLHQPLHAAQLWSNTFTKGDEGGNKFNITYSNERGDPYTVLHPLYDDVGGEFNTAIKFPPASIEPFRNELMTNTKNLLRDFPKSMFSPEQLQPNISTAALFDTALASWLNESWAIAKDSYSQLEVGQNLTDSQFIVDLRKTLKRQIALGGYRLAHVLRRVSYTRLGALPDRSESVTPGWRAAAAVFLTLFLLVSLLFVFYAYRIHRRNKRMMGTTTVEVREHGPGGVISYTTM